MTIYEAEKLNEINQKVSTFNDENQFNDTNLVSATINELIDIEMEAYGTVRKAFWTILFYVFIATIIVFWLGELIIIAVHFCKYPRINIDMDDRMKKVLNLYNDRTLFCQLYRIISIFLKSISFVFGFIYYWKKIRINQQTNHVEIQ